MLQFFRPITALLCLLLALNAAPAGAQVVASDRDCATAQRLAQLFFAGRAAELHPWLHERLAARLTEADLLALARTEASRAPGAPAVLRAEPVPGERRLVLVPVLLGTTQRAVRIGWVGELVPGSVLEFTIEERRPTPVPTPRRFSLPPFPDAAYVDRARFVERELTIPTVQSHTLRAVLTVPGGAAAGGFPAVLIAGEGGTRDADGTIGLNRPWQDLAHGLASRGIASLRYETRAHADHALLPPAWTAEDEFLSDAASALAVLRREGGGDPSRVYLLGVGRGAYFAPELARRDGAVAGLILVNPPANLNIRRELARLEERVAAGEVPYTEAERLRAVIDLLERRAIPRSDSVAGMSGAYWHHLETLDPLRWLLDYKGSVIVLQGALDDATGDEDRLRWAVFLRHSKRPAEFFMERGDRYLIASRPGIAAGSAPGHVSEAAIDHIITMIAP